VVRRECAPIVVDLGDASTMDDQIGGFREMLRDPTRTKVSQLGRALYEQIMQPVQPQLRGVSRLLISPDGQLDLLPFEALLDREGHYLFQRYVVTYLSTGRDLLRMQVTRATKSEPVVVADPLFGTPRATRVATAQATKPRMASARAAGRSVTTAKDLRSVYFAPLANTRL